MSLQQGQSIKCIVTKLGLHLMYQMMYLLKVAKFTNIVSLNTPVQSVN